MSFLGLPERIHLLRYRAEGLTKKAEENLNTVMPGYTHRKQAQPITLGHYLMAHVEAAGRSAERLEDVYKRMNQNTLGAAALAGTGWPIDAQEKLEQAEASIKQSTGDE